MSSDLARSIKRLRSTSNKLNSLTDQANESVQQVENFLAHECRIGLPAFIHVRDLDDFGHDSEFLEYRKLGNRFRIAVVRTTNQGDDEVSVRAWSECNRDTKHSTIKFLPKLLDKISEEMNKAIESSQEDIVSVSSAINAAIESEE